MAGRKLQQARAAVRAGAGTVKAVLMAMGINPENQHAADALAGKPLGDGHGYPVGIMNGLVQQHRRRARTYAAVAAAVQAVAEGPDAPRPGPRVGPDGRRMSCNRPATGGRPGRPVPAVLAGDMVDRPPGWPAGLATPAEILAGAGLFQRGR